VQVAQYRRDMVVSRRTMNQSGGSIEDRLQTLVLVGRKPCECRVAVVEAWHNQRLIVIDILSRTVLKLSQIVV